MRILKIFLALIASLAITTAASAQTKPAKDYVVLKVGAEEIKYSDVLDVWSTLFPGDEPPDFNTFDDSVKQNVLRGMISERLLYQEAVKQGIDKSPEVQKRLQSLEKQLVIQSMIEKQTKSLISETALKKAYEEKASRMKTQEEVRARHILVDSEEEANKIYDEIKNGGDFAKIARDKSVDKGSGARGGDLDFFTKDKMVPEFAEAAFKLKKGEVSNPTKSEFGWHIIKLEERRKAKIAPFNEIRDSLQADVQQKGIQDYLDSLVKTSEVKYFDASGKELPFDKNHKNPISPQEVP